ncbi:acyltransferase family protein [Oribacterium sp. P6A1]|uniref:acyltransferase family protein n=1 Tax=Oribacterium sp. P6A1 TaxID=1410612 RepID=UPI000565D995|nr:acyltransferase [Oribacterium sp. P6A1]
MAKSGFSNKVYIYTFIMSVLVVLVHAVNFASDNSTLLLMIQSSDLNCIDLGGMTGISAHIENFFSNALGQAAVPGFFMMSGYLFYRTMTGIKDIGKKWKSRFSSIVVPYGVWNVIYYLVYVALGRAAFCINELNSAVTVYKYNPLFWYLYQLILLSILAPVFYILLKNRIIAFASFFLYLGFLIKGGDLPLINEDAVIYYFAGGLMSRFWTASFEKGKKSGIILGTFLIVLTWSTQIFTTVGMQNFVIAPIDLQKMESLSFWYFGGRVSEVLGALIVKLPEYVLIYILSPGGQLVVNALRRLFLCLGIWLILSGKMPEAKGYMKNSFFLYAVHFPIARGVIFMLEYMNVGYHGTGEQVLRLVAYFATPVISIAVADGLKQILKKYIPFSWKLLSGGR